MSSTFMSAVLFVRDMQVSRAFYEGLLGQKVQMDHGLNVGFEGGFALWQADHAESIIFGQPLKRAPRLGSDNVELYFETDQLDDIWQRMAEAGTQVVHAIREQPWGQRVFRVYDPDGYIVELGEPMPLVIMRFVGEGLSAEAIAKRTYMPEDIVRQIIAAAKQPNG